MRIEQFKYLVTIAEYMSFSKASNILFLSPQALSRSMTALERELGYSIFIRFSTGVQFTPEGLLILDMAKRILKDYEDTLTLLEEKNTAQEKTIYLYSHNSFTDAFLNHIALKYNATVKNIQIIIKEYSEKILKQLQNNQDENEANWLIFCTYRNKNTLPIEIDALQNIKLYSDLSLSSKYIACVNKDNILAQQKSVSMKVLSTFPFVRFAISSEDGTDALDYIDIYYKDQKIRTSYRLPNVSSWINAIAAGYGIGLIDELICNKHSACKEWFNKITTIPIMDSETIYHGFYAATKPTKEVEDFMHFAMRELKNML